MAFDALIEKYRSGNSDESEEKNDCNKSFSGDITDGKFVVEFRETYTNKKGDWKQETMKKIFETAEEFSEALKTFKAE